MASASDAIDIGPNLDRQLIHVDVQSRPLLIPSGGGAITGGKVTGNPLQLQNHTVTHLQRGGGAVGVGSRKPNHRSLNQPPIVTAAKISPLVNTLQLTVVPVFPVVFNSDPLRLPVVSDGPTLHPSQMIVCS